MARTDGPDSLPVTRMGNLIPALTKRGGVA